MDRGRIQSILLFPLHLSILLLLHSIFASIRLVGLIKKLLVIHQHQHESTTSPTPTPTRDLIDKRWNKLPKHLGIVLTSTSPSTKKRDLNRVVKWVEWCKQLGITDLTLYDREGLLVSNAKDIARELQQIDKQSQSPPLVIKENEAYPGIVTLTPQTCSSSLLNEETSLDSSSSTSSSSSSSTLVVNESNSTITTTTTTTTTKTPPPVSKLFTLRLISRKAGRPQLAKLAQTLAINNNNKKKKSQSSSSSSSSSVTGLLKSEEEENISEMIDCGLSLILPEPDLILIFGGSHSRLLGFPPWQLRLSEI
ncbi:hypothetical protein JCM3765_001993 [Sporobolomyces pararoseus]